jgi:hypothetical protein
VREQVVLVAALGLTIAALLARFGPRRRALRWVVGAPLLLASLRLLVVWSGPGTADLWSVSALAGTWLDLALLGLAGVGAAVLAGERQALRRTPAVVFAVVVGAVWLGQTVPSLLDPTYTVRDAGRAIEQLAVEGEVVVSRGSATAFLPTSIDYVESFEPEEDHGLLVAAMHHTPDETGPRRYRLIRTLPLNLGVWKELRIYRRLDAP